MIALKLYYYTQFYLCYGYYYQAYAWVWYWSVIFPLVNFSTFNCSSNIMGFLLSQFVFPLRYLYIYVCVCAFFISDALNSGYGYIYMKNIHGYMQYKCCVDVYTRTNIYLDVRKYIPNGNKKKILFIYFFRVEKMLFMCNWTHLYIQYIHTYKYIHVE